MGDWKEMKKVCVLIVALLLISLFSACAAPVASPTKSGIPTSSSIPISSPTVSPSPTASPSPTPNKVQPSDAAKTAANSDDTGAPYFITYDYDATNYLVSAYENQQGPGNYTGGSSLYLINKSTGKVLANTQIDLSKVDFSKYLTVYSKLSRKIIE